jgi:hypothetical protein
VNFLQPLVPFNEILYVKDSTVMLKIKEKETLNVPDPRLCKVKWQLFVNFTVFLLSMYFFGIVTF